MPNIEPYLRDTLPGRIAVVASVILLGMLGVAFIALLSTIYRLSPDSVKAAASFIGMAVLESLLSLFLAQLLPWRKE